MKGTIITLKIQIVLKKMYGYNNLINFNNLFKTALAIVFLLTHKLENF